MSDLTKREKALSRELIEKGLQRECGKFMNTLRRKLNAPDERTPHDQYLDIYKMVQKFEKHLGFRYWKVTGSHYLEIVESLYVDGIISDNEIDGYEEDNKDYLRRCKSIVDSHRRK